MMGSLLDLPALSVSIASNLMNRQMIVLFDEVFVGLARSMHQ